MRILIISTLIFLCVSTGIAQEYKNYCHDKDAWKEWDELVAKHPHDMDVQMLHAVRIGFCKKIKDGSISNEMAVDAFDHLHKTVIERAQKAKEQHKRNEQL